ncbi:DeoR/GlpR family DNA-binding transcription regulator [Lactovum odontotermitis]
MIKEERQSKIIELIDKNTFLTVSDIAGKIGVSEMTIRRDITELDEKNLVTKRYGGVQKKAPSDQKTLTTKEKLPSNIKEKKYIGKILNRMIPDGATIFVAAGTTMFYALQEIKAKNLSVITNSLIAFNYLKEETDYRILLTGGEFNSETDEFSGPATLRFFEDLNIDITFAATNGVIGKNITSSSFDLGWVENAAFDKSKIKCVVLDSSKLGKSDVYTFMTLDKIDYLITDNKITDEQLREYGQYTKILTKAERLRERHSRKVK